VQATQTDPGFAPAFRSLGEAYLVEKKGSLAIPALNEALRLAPMEMAQCHLMLAWLFDAAGDRKDAAAQYKEFLKKVPDHPEKAKMEKYIAENPE
jgi:tetratricopeptide (TPR) repeat protein